MCVNGSCQALGKTQISFAPKSNWNDTEAWALNSDDGDHLLVPHNSNISTEIPRSGITELTVRVSPMFGIPARNISITK